MLSALEILGLSGTITIALCSLPQVYESIKTGQTGMNKWMIILWFLGVLQMFIFTLIKTADPLVYANYIASIVFSLVILKYKIFPRKT